MILAVCIDPKDDQKNEDKLPGVQKTFASRLSIPIEDSLIDRYNNRQRYQI